MDHDPQNVKSLEELDEKSFIEFGPGFDVRMISDSPKPREYILQETGTIDESVTGDRPQSEGTSEPEVLAPRTDASSVVDPEKRA